MACIFLRASICVVQPTMPAMLCSSFRPGSLFSGIYWKRSQVQQFTKSYSAVHRRGIWKSLAHSVDLVHVEQELVCNSQKLRAQQSIFSASNQVTADHSLLTALPRATQGHSTLGLAGELVLSSPSWRSHDAPQAAAPGQEGRDPLTGGGHRNPGQAGRQKVIRSVALGRATGSALLAPSPVICPASLTSDCSAVAAGCAQ